jgi:hypothetical protein
MVCKRLRDLCRLYSSDESSDKKTKQEKSKQMAVFLRNTRGLISSQKLVTLNSLKVFFGLNNKVWTSLDLSSNRWIQTSVSRFKKTRIRLPEKIHVNCDENSGDFEIISEFSSKQTNSIRISASDGKTLCQEILQLTKNDDDIDTDTVVSL